MYKQKTIAVIIPCYNEETQIEDVIKTMPEYVDQIVVVDDFSDDNTIEVVENLTRANSEIKLIKEKPGQIKRIEPIPKDLL